MSESERNYRRFRESIEPELALKRPPPAEDGQKSFLNPNVFKPRKVKRWDRRRTDGN